MARSPTIVIDAGAFMTRVGISGKDVPEETFPTVVGFEKEGGCGSFFVGRDATEIRDGSLELARPVDRYAIRDDQAMCHIWEFCCLDVLGCDTLEDCPVLVTDGPKKGEARHSSRAKIAEILFEKCKVPSFYIAMQPYLSLLSIDKTTGLVADIGHSMASVVPVVEGAVVHEGVLTSDAVSGRQITDHLMEMLNQREGVSITDRETARAIKETLGYVACEYESEFKWAGSVTKDFTLPDGKVIAVGTERFRCTEPLFQPGLLGQHGGAGLESGQAPVGVQDMVMRALAGCSASDRPRLLGTVVLAGGSTQFPNLAERLGREVRMRSSSSDQASSTTTGEEVTVLAPPTRAWSAWLGGSLLADRDGFHDAAVSRQEFQEQGPDIVRQKCTN